MININYRTTDSQKYKKINKISSKNKLLTLMSTALVCFTSNYFAATETTSFTVNATVTDTCQNLTAENINFGNYNPLAASNTDATGNIQITCTNNTNYSVALSPGGGGAYNSRQLSDGGSNSLNYNLYTSSNYSSVWGDGTANSDTVNQTGSGNQDSLTVYGRITAGQSAANASYSDTINVTVTY